MRHAFFHSKRGSIRALRAGVLRGLFFKKAKRAFFLHGTKQIKHGVFGSKKGRKTFFFVNQEGAKKHFEDRGGKADARPCIQARVQRGLLPFVLFGRRG